MIQAVFGGEALELIPVGVYVVDAAGIIQHYNRRAAELWGRAPQPQDPNQRFCGSMRMYRPDGTALPHDQCPVADVLRTGEPARNAEVIIERPDGSRVTVVVNIGPLRDAQGRIVGAINCFQDITERQRAEQRLRTTAERVTLLAESATRLLLEERPRELTRELFNGLSTHLQLEVYFNYLVNDEGTGLRLNAFAGVDATDADLLARLQSLQFGEAICGTVAQTRQRIVVEDVQNSTLDIADFVRSLGLGAYACHPLLAHGRLIGTLSFGSRQRKRFWPDELELMRALSDQVAVALDRKRLADELANRAEELAVANAAKDKFLAALSHELRTPLAPVLMTATAMENDPALPVGFREDVALIRRHIELEARLIDDLLDLTRVARGKLELHCEFVDAHALLRDALQTCCGSDDFGNKRLTFVTDLRAATHHVWADAARLAQVFWNLIRNAIKFTPDGGRVEIRTMSAGDDRLRVTVSDSGVGIDPELLPRIFDAFEQGTRATTRHFGGLGLGLAISKALVDMHGGTIAAHSDGEGRGASFTLEIATTRVPTSSTPPLARPAVARRGLRILLVEDHEMTARVLERLLRGMDYDVATAGSVRHALDAARAAAFDLLISDLGLPDGSGLDLMRELTRMYEIKGIALSGYGMEDDIRRSREVGFAAHLTKPVSIEKLQATINQVA